MNTSKSPTRLKSIYKFSKLDNFSFNFFTLQFLLVMIFLFLFDINYAAWASFPIIALLLYFSFSKRFYFSQKAIIAISALTAYFTFTFILYGKTFPFLVINYITPIVLLIVIRYHKAMFILSFLIFTIVATTIYFDFFKIDLGGPIQEAKNIGHKFFYFDFLMIALYLIVLLTSRSNLVKDIIYDLKIKNGELEESRAELKKLQINKESFFAIMSHEIRTPLNAVKGISDILKNNKLNEDVQNLLELMDYSSNHMLALVNNILDFTKLNDGAFNLQYSEFNLIQSLQSVFKMNEKLALEKGLDFTFSISDTLPQSVFGDKNRINQIILNLLNNAIEYTTVGSIEMIVDGSPNPNNHDEFQFHITISDTGKGIDKELSGKLFEKYATSNTSKNSVGLGLTITKGLLDLMAGTITYDSKLNRGTTFYIMLPLPIVAEKFENLEYSDENSLSKTLKILIVDDNSINLLILEKQLKNNLKNSEINVAKNGLEAINLIKRHDYDIVLMDVIMPVMDGISATIEVRNWEDKNKKDVPIIALTANVGDNELRDCIEAGMNDFVTKPFEISSILKIISKETQASNTILNT